jgi:hypothetical protein
MGSLKLIFELEVNLEEIPRISISKPEMDLEIFRKENSKTTIKTESYREDSMNGMECNGAEWNHTVSNP